MKKFEARHLELEVGEIVVAVMCFECGDTTEILVDEDEQDLKEYDEDMGNNCEACYFRSFGGYDDSEDDYGRETPFSVYGYSGLGLKCGY